MRSAGNEDWDRYNLQETAEALAGKHHATHCLCVRASVLLRGGHAAYADFCPSYEAGNKIPTYDGARGRATEHLVALLDNTLGPSWEDGTVHIVAFSRGLVVMNQLIAELAQSSFETKAEDQVPKLHAVRRLWTRVRALHDVDGANEGPHYPLPADGMDAASRWLSLAELGGANAADLSWCLHTTPYTFELDPRAIPEKEPEQSAFIDAVRKSSSGLVKVNSYHGASLRDHFRCLEDYSVQD
jgi:hypothetical protein